METNEVFKTILNQYYEDKLSHAFLLETDDVNKCTEDLLEVIKKLVCPFIFDADCKENCNICHLIDIKEMPDLVIIKPDNNMIKKESVLNLKEKFSTMPAYGRNNIYIVKEADKLNSSSANSLLKFIEEPENMIYGFLITTSKDKVLPTILSRCEKYQIYYNMPFLQSEKKALLSLAEDFVMKLENLNLSELLIQKALIISCLDEKEKALFFFESLYNLYFSKINDETLDDRTSKLVVKKIKIIDNILRKANYNVNLELFFDKLLVEMVRLNE